jgi:glycosyltransferase involved in cell wall biosynthesis
MAQGRYIAFLDSDDVWLPEKLEKQITFMKTHSPVLSYTAYEKIDEKGARKGRIVPVPERGNYEDLLRGCFIGCLTAVYDTHLIGKVYLPPIIRGQDYGLWLKILRNGH